MTCDNCGADLITDGGTDIYYCPKCGEEFIYHGD